MNRRIAAVTLSTLVAVSLAGCTLPPIEPDASSASGTPSPRASVGAQSVADACALVQDTIDEATDEFGKAATADPAEVIAAMRSAAQKLSDAAAEISNEEVEAVLPDLRATFEKTADIMQGIADGDVGKLDDLAALGDDFQETSTRFQQLCESE